MRTTVPRTGEAGERERQRQREEREREGELLRLTGTLRLLQVYSEPLRSSKAGSINTLLKRGPLGYLEGHEAGGIPERERSPRAGAREARAGRCLSIRDAVGPRQQVALRGSLYCRPLALSARINTHTFTCLFRFSESRACSAARSGAISSSSSYAYAWGGSGDGIFHSLRNVLDIATPPPSPLPPPPTPLHTFSS